jgi:hypothetical protein
MTRLAPILAVCCLGACCTTPQAIPTVGAVSEASTAAYQAATNSTLGWLAIACGMAGIGLVVASMFIPLARATGITLIALAVGVAVVPAILAIIEPQIAVVAWIAAAAAVGGIGLLGLRAWEHRRGRQEIVAEAERVIAKLRRDEAEELEDGEPMRALMDRGGRIAMQRLVGDESWRTEQDVE